MTLNPIMATVGRRLRLAVIGGCPGSFIGAMHRHAARLDDRYEIVAGVLSADPRRARKYGVEIGLAPEASSNPAKPTVNGYPAGSLQFMKRTDMGQLVYRLPPFAERLF